jgi:hypothetical protein
MDRFYILAIAIVVAGLLIYTTSGSAVAYVVNRFTGNAWLCAGGTCFHTNTQTETLPT